MTAPELKLVLGRKWSVAAVKAGRKYLLDVHHKKESYTYKEVHAVAALEAFGIAVESLAREVER